MKKFIRLILLSFLILPLVGCSAQPTIVSTATITPPPQPPTLVTITGWFTTVWNGGEHYFITDDQGITTRLLLDEEITTPLGGPLALDRKKVTVSGEIVSDPPGALQVLSVRIEGQ